MFPQPISGRQVGTTNRWDASLVGREGYREVLTFQYGGFCFVRVMKLCSEACLAKRHDFGCNFCFAPLTKSYANNRTV